MFRGKITAQPQNSHNSSRLSDLKKSKIESNSDTIQKQVELYTRKLEEQKKRLFRVQQNQKQTTEEYNTQVSQLDKLKSKKMKNQYSSLCSKVKCLEGNLEKGITAYNQAISKNNSLKIEIDELRKQRKNQMQTFQSLQQKIEEINNSMQNIDKDTQIKRSKVDYYKNQILAIKNQNQKHQKNCQNQVSSLTNSLKFDKDFQNTLKSQAKKDTTTQTSDTQPIMKHRLKNLIHQNKQKMKVIEQYRRSMQKIEKSFQQIQNESGINDVEEITSILLKQEQQNIFILQYIDKLNSEFENIRTQNQRIRNRIQQKQRKNSEYRLVLSGTPQAKKREEEIRNFIQIKNQPIKKTNRFLQTIQKQLFDILIQEQQNQKQNSQVDTTTISDNKNTNYQAQILTILNVEEYLAKMQIIIDKQAKKGTNNQNTHRRQVSIRKNQDYSVKDDITKYSKAVPGFLMEQLKDRGEESILEEDKLRQYAMQFWDKKKNLRA